MSSTREQEISLAAMLNSNEIASVELKEEEGAYSNEDFEKTVGLVEDIFVGDNFQNRHSDYFMRHCTKFSKGTDPPLGSAELEELTKERFNIFRTYSVETSTFLEHELKRGMGENFEFEKFIQEVEKRTVRVENGMPPDAGGSATLPQETTDNNGIAEAAASGQSALTPEVVGGEIFEMLLTLKDYARFQELMFDYLEMLHGNTPDFEGLVSYRHLPDEQD